MLVVASMLAVFSAQIGLFIACDLSEILGVQAGVRLIVWLTVLTGIAGLIKKQYPNWENPNTRTTIPQEHIRAKTLGLACVLTLILIYAKLMDSLGWVPCGEFLNDFAYALPAIIVLFPFYIRWADRRLPVEHDSLQCFGETLTGQRVWIFSEQKQFLLSWAVKIFFTPTMYGSLILLVSELLLSEISAPHPTMIIAWLFIFGLSFDVLIASAGYIFSSRFLGTSVIHTNENWLGWLVCIICYPPFMTIFHSIREQADNQLWHHWLSPNDPLYWLWALLITATWMIYWFSTASFGLRFSNLNWRGLIDHGPYRYSKHPSYIAKNLYWWLHTVPFFGVDNWVDMTRNFLALTFVSGVYYLRAKTEEQHLMRFPEYAAYAERIAQNGLLARLKRICPRICR